MNSEKLFCGSFGLYPGYAAGILNSVGKIHLYVVCSEQLNYENHIKNYIAGQTAIFLIKRIKYVISSYRLVVKPLLCLLKQK